MGPPTARLRVTGTRRQGSQDATSPCPCWRVGGKWDKLIVKGRNVVIMTSGQEREFGDRSAWDLSHPLYRRLPAGEGL